MWSSINFIKQSFSFSDSVQSSNKGGVSISSKPSFLGIWYFTETKKVFLNAILFFFAGIASGRVWISLDAASLNSFLARFKDSLSKKLTPTTLEFDITFEILPFWSISNFTLTIASRSFSQACLG